MSNDMCIPFQERFPVPHDLNITSGQNHSGRPYAKRQLQVILRATPLAQCGSTTMTWPEQATSKTRPLLTNLEQVRFRA